MHARQSGPYRNLIMLLPGLGEQASESGNCQNSHQKFHLTRGRRGLDLSVREARLSPSYIIALPASEPIQSGIHGRAESQLWYPIRCGYGTRGTAAMELTSLGLMRSASVLYCIP
jgi:hypothetical protein